MSAPVWGRFSDRFGRRPALLVALGASAIAYVIFGFANSLAMLFISRIVQGAGGGTVGVIQAYVADSVEPDQRARGLGWLSAATNLGVAFGPVLGAFSITLGNKVCNLGGGDVAGLHAVGHAMPGLLAALLCLVNMAFAWHYLRESRRGERGAASDAAEAALVARGRAASARAFRRARVAAHLDLRDRHGRVSGCDRGARAVSRGSLPGDRADDQLLLHVHRIDLRVHASAAARQGGRSIRRGAPVADSVWCCWRSDWAGCRSRDRCRCWRSPSRSSRSAPRSRSRA